ncbi:MAG: PAS domain S-box protein, partial [Ignavibacteria bacterium]|nr:PAS domain S-box protein [Ignavibacteria bacterium]
ATSPITDYSRPIFNENNKITGAVFVFRDKRHEIEHHKELISSAKSYKGLFNSIKSAAYVQDREGRFLDVNEGALELYGYPRESFIGATPEFLAAPGMNDMSALAAHIQSAFNGESRQFEFWGRKRNGEIFPKEVNLFKTTYFDKEAIIAIAHDITERKKIVSALSYSEERYRTLFNSSPVGIILEDLDGDIIEVNQTICDDFGYTAEDIIGQNIEFIVPEKIRPQVKNNIEQIVEHGVLQSRVESVSKDNSIRISELIESLVVLPDGRKGILSISKNITEQVLAEQTLIRSEARNKAIISAIPDLFFRFDKTNKIIDCVAKETHLLFEKPENFIGKFAAEVLPLELAQLTEQKIQISLETGELQQYEYSMNLQDEIHWFEARMIKSSEEEVLVIVREITDRKKAEQEIQQQSKFIETLLESIPNPLFYMSNEGVFLGVNKAFREFYNYSSDAIVGKSLFDIDDQLTAIRNFNSDKLIFEGKETIQVIERGILLPSGEERSIILTKSPFPDSEGGIGGLIGLIVDISARKKME